MLFDDLQEQLKTIEPDIAIIQSYWKNARIEEEYQKLDTQSVQEDFWQHPKQTEILKELQRLRVQREQYQYILNTQQELYDLIELFAQEESELRKLEKDMIALRKAVSAFKVALLLNQADDDTNCFLTINSGAGGTESQDWAEILLRMYVRFCEREKLGVDIVDQIVGEEAGIKSATLFIKGKNVHGL